MLKINFILKIGQFCDSHHRCVHYKNNFKKKNDLVIRSRQSEVSVNRSSLALVPYRIDIFSQNLYNLSLPSPAIFTKLGILRNIAERSLQVVGGIIVSISGVSAVGGRVGHVARLGRVQPRRDVTRRSSAPPTHRPQR